MIEFEIIKKKLNICVALLLRADLFSITRTNVQIYPIDDVLFSKFHVLHIIE